MNYPQYPLLSGALYQCSSYYSENVGYDFQLEDLDVEICDEIYEAYTDLLRQQEEDDDTLCYKTYTLVSSAEL